MGRGPTPIDLDFRDYFEYDVRRFGTDWLFDEPLEYDILGFGTGVAAWERILTSLIRI